MIHNKKSAPYWQKDVSTLLQEFDTSEKGLNKNNAEERLKRYGLNQIKSESAYFIWEALLLRFKNVLVLLLLASSLLLAIVGDINSAIIIALMLFISISLDVFQEQRAGKIASTLQHLIVPTVSVLRDGIKITIKANKVVPGDVLEVSSGDVIPADGIILASKDAFINAAALTGESFPVEKGDTTAPTNHIKNVIEAPNILLMGTAIASGWARMMVCATGKSTYLGSIVDSLKRDRPSSRFMHSTQEFGVFLARIALILVALTFLINLYSEKTWLDILLFSVALGVGITPELLPMIVSVSLAKGAAHLSHHKILVKKMSSIYDLGCMDILCTDKTGTLTEAIITLKEHSDWQGQSSEKLLKLAYINSALSSSFQNPLDQAIINHQEFDIKSYTKIDEIPFDHRHRRVSVLVDNSTERLLILKGPVDDVLSLCQFVETGNNSIPLDETKRQLILKNFKDLSQNGCRILGVAWCTLPKDQNQITIDAETNLTFSGTLSFTDNPKKTSKAVLESLSKHSVQTKIITGDNEYVTQYLCHELNLPITGILTGAEMSALDEHQLKTAVITNNIFCRISPDQKRQIVQTLKANGHVVGFLGDGVNDIAALYNADVGITVENAAPAAKSAAHFILLDHNLALIEQGIIAGRRTFANIMKYAMMGTSSNFGNMISMVIASLFLPFFPMLPIQIFLNNLLYDFAGTSIPFDTVDPENCAQPSKWDTTFIKKFMLFFGPLSSIFDCLVFYVLLYGVKATVPIFQTAWFIESLITQTFVIFVIRTRRTLFNSHPHKGLIITTFLIAGVGISLPYTPFAPLFGLVPIPPLFLLGLLGITVLYLALTELAKHYFYSRVLVKKVNV